MPTHGKHIPRAAQPNARRAYSKDHTSLCTAIAHAEGGTSQYTENTRQGPGNPMLGKHRPRAAHSNACLVHAEGNTTRHTHSTHQGRTLRHQCSAIAQPNALKVLAKGTTTRHTHSTHQGPTPLHHCSASTRRGYHNPMNIKHVQRAPQPKIRQVHANGSTTRHLYMFSSRRACTTLKAIRTTMHLRTRTVLAPAIRPNSTHRIRIFRERLELVTQAFTQNLPGPFTP